MARNAKCESFNAMVVGCVQQAAGEQARASRFAGNTNDHARAGRWHDANRTRMIAFAMGTHAGFANDAEIGGTTSYSADFPEELMRDMFHRMRFAVREESSAGVRGLLGIQPESADFESL